ncbi:MAG: hybrid sensor histidine kinase/response regulator, partial [Pseudomonadota bacterium]|nr:hybrid sensor histidine kinase/response regulator [Pseudomonadota bacterium]
MQLLIWPARAQVAASQIAIGPAHGVDILPGALLFIDTGGAWPSSAAALPAWTATLTKTTRVSPNGGAYWMIASIRNPSADSRWVIHLINTVVDRADILVLGADGSAQHVVSGYRAPHDYMLHSANDVTLAPRGDYMVVMRFSSQSFMRAPGVSVVPQAAFRQLVAHDNALILGSLGALAALAIVNLFIFSFTRNPANLYYAIYLVAYSLAWAMPFNVLADLFDWHEARMHYVPFFLLPVFSTLFYLHFLRLKKVAPLLASISRINLVLPLLLLPTCFFAPALAHKLATLVCTFWMVLALVSGIVAWKRGFKPARYFVFAFVALMAPGLLVVPANFGLLDTLQINVAIVTLVGGTLDALLLAFALADQIRLMSSRMEQNVARRTQELVSANDALTIAKERAEVISRHRIDFLSAMSHDIRTPLAGVIGMLKLGLRDAAVQGRTAEYLRIGLRNGESLLVILNDILDFSKIDAGKLTLELTTFPLASLVADAVGILQGQADLKGLALRV